MQQVLSRPHEYPVLNMDGPDETDYDVKWLYEIQNYHQQQVQNWRNLQHELH